MSILIQPYMTEGRQPWCGLTTKRMVSLIIHLINLSTNYIARFNDRLPQKERKNGFSLIELVMVMVILGILVSVAIPKMTNVLDKAELKIEQAVNQIWGRCEQYT